MKGTDGPVRQSFQTRQKTPHPFPTFVTRAISASKNRTTEAEEIGKFMDMESETDEELEEPVEVGRNREVKTELKVEKKTPARKRKSVVDTSISSSLVSFRVQFASLS